ncbi:class A beta-lactamase, partial [bacterium]
MSHPLTRRNLLVAAVVLPLCTATRIWAKPKSETVVAKLAKLEKSLDGRLGVYAFDTATGAQLHYRADERFPVNSTFKALLGAAILDRSEHEVGFLERRIRFSNSDLVTHSPVTGEHLADGLTVAQLCAATIQTSDNTAANLLMKILGGPSGVTAYARSIGDHKFRLDRWETELNTAIPDDLRDTSTPKAMAQSLRRVTVGHALEAEQRQRLITWLRGSTTGAKRIRAGVPKNWIVGDKTGTGEYGTAHDIAVLWPPRRRPIV